MVGGVAIGGTDASNNGAASGSGRRCGRPSERKVWLGPLAEHQFRRVHCTAASAHSCTDTTSLDPMVRYAACPPSTLKLKDNLLTARPAAAVPASWLAFIFVKTYADWDLAVLVFGEWRETVFQFNHRLLPEHSVVYQWIQMTTQQARKNQCILFIEYWPASR